MLLTLMYHRVGEGKYANSQEILFEHLKFLKEHYPIVLPGDPLPKRKLAICLTFDDATYDFYHYVFPMLKKLNLKALLGVPVYYIQETTSVPYQERLSVPYTLMMQDGFYDQKIPFCTWEELNEMVNSKHVEVASHSYMHCNLTFDFVDLNREVVLSKEILEKKLAQPITSFIYPFGRKTPALHEYVAEHYAYIFRIGSALNFGWGNPKRVLNRLSADNLTHYTAPLNPWILTKAFTKSLFS